MQKESGFARTDRGHGALVRAAARLPRVGDARARVAAGHRAPELGPWGEVLFPGLFALVLGAVGLVARARAGASRATARRRCSTARSAVLAFWASFGPGAGLYRVLYYLPTFSFLRAPSRLGLVVVLCLVVFAAIALRRLLRRAHAARPRGSPRRSPWSAAIAERRGLSAQVVDAPRSAVARTPRSRAARARPLAEFPFYGERIAFPLHAQYMLFSTSHWMPMVNGYSDVIPADFREAAAVLDGFPSNDAFAVLARRRVRYIAIHWDMYAGRHDEIRRRLEPYARTSGFWRRIRG